MRVLVTGATGFVGRWLSAELGGAGHEVIGTPSRSDLDLGDPGAITAFIRDLRPDAIAHLAGVSSSGEAAGDPATAIRTNIGGTTAIVEAAGSMPILVASSAEVYRLAPDTELPLTERSPLGPRGVYGQTKLGAEAVAIAAAAERGARVVVTRSFNHTGPGQRIDFVVPAFARRILEARAEGATSVRVGDLDVERDLLDVRDVVRAYRALLELAVAEPARAPRVVNVASGRATSIRALARRLAELAGVDVTLEVDPALVRADTPPLVVGDASLLRRLTGWSPRVDQDTTLRDVLEDQEAVLTASPTPAERSARAMTAERG